MKYLFIKFRRDVARMWVQFIAVFMMSVLAITIYSGMEGVWYGLKCETDSYYEETKLADAWVNGTQISDDMVSQIAHLEEIEKVDKAMTLTLGVTSFSDKTDLKVISTDSTDLFAPVIRDGAFLDTETDDFIWIDETFANERDLSVGDEISLKYNDKEKKLKIAGTILHSEFIYYTGSVTDTVPDHKHHGYAWISEKTAKNLYGGYVCNELRLRLTDEDDVPDSEIESILGDAYYNFSVRDDISSVSQIKKEINQMQNMANLFSAVFIMLAILCMYSTMTRIVHTQTLYIGTMKAIGFSNLMIRLHYVCYGLFVSLIGCLCGTFMGKNIVSRAVMRIKKATLTMPEWKVSLSKNIYLVIGAIVLVCVGATLLAVQKTMNQYPAESMRSNQNVKKNKHYIGSNNNKLWKKFSYQTKWMIRDNLQNIVRWIISIIGIAGSMVLMMAGLGFHDSINYSNDYVYNKQFSYQYKAVLNTVDSPEEILAFEKNFTGTFQREYEYSIDIFDQDNNKERRTISVIEDGDFIHLEDTNGNSLSLTEDALVISRKTADKLDLKKGDKVKFRILGRPDYYEAEITDIAISPSPQGIFISNKYLEKNFDGKFVPNTYLFESEEDYDAIADLDIVKEITDIDSQFDNMKIMTKSVMTIIYLMIIASVLLGCIIIYNLGMLSFIERMRDYATMKVIGFYQKEIRSIIIRDSLIVTVIGWLIGIPVGYWFLSFYIGIVQFKTFEWVPTLTVLSFCISTLIVILVSLIVNLVVANKVKKISMVEALKSVE